MTTNSSSLMDDLVQINSNMANLLIEAISMLSPATCINLPPKPLQSAIELQDYAIYAGWSLSHPMKDTGIIITAHSIPEAFTRLKKEFREDNIMDMSLVEPHTMALLTKSIPIIYQVRV